MSWLAGLCSTLSGFFGGSGGSSVVLGLGLCLLAALGLAECRQGQVEALSLQLGAVESALAASERGRDELRDELGRQERILLGREVERAEARAELEADRAEAARLGGAWLDQPVPVAVLRLFDPGAVGASGGSAAAGAAGRVAAGGAGARLAWEY